MDESVDECLMDPLSMMIFPVAKPVIKLIAFSFGLIDPIGVDTPGSHHTISNIEVLCKEMVLVPFLVVGEQGTEQEIEFSILPRLAITVKIHQNAESCQSPIIIQLICTKQQLSAVHEP